MATVKTAPVAGPTIAWERPGSVAVLDRAHLKAEALLALRTWLIGMVLLGSITLALIHQLAPDLTRRSAVGLIVATFGLPLAAIPSLWLDLRSNPQYVIGPAGATRKSPSSATRHRWKALLGYRIVSHAEARGMRCLEFRVRSVFHPIAWPFDPSTTPDREIVAAMRHYRPDLALGAGF